MPDTNKPKTLDSRSLLLALVALRTGLVTQKELSAALSVWSNDPAQKLGRLLLDSGKLSAKELAALEVVVTGQWERYGADVEKLITNLKMKFGSPNFDSQVISLGSKLETLLTSKDSVAEEPLGLFGNYHLIEEVGRGGMGVVYKARDIRLNRIVALKMILPKHLARDTQIARFHSEAEAVAKLDHPGIAPIFEIGEHAGRHYFTMGFVEGADLLDKTEKGPLSFQEAAEIVQQTAAAVHHAHQHGIVHRDLKPPNILLDKAGKVKLTDFGLAIHLEEEGRNVTSKGFTAGTPTFMAPEQVSDEIQQIGPATDVYALGAILYTLVTGRPPYQAATAFETLKLLSTADLVPPRKLNALVPKDLDTICVKCLEKKPIRRYASAKELADELGRFLRGEPIRARALAPTTRAWRWCKRNPLNAALLTVLAAILFGLSIAGPSVAVYQASLSEYARKAKETAEEEARRAKEQTELAKELARNEAMARKAADIAREKAEQERLRAMGETKVAVDLDAKLAEARKDADAAVVRTRAEKKRADSLAEKLSAIQSAQQRFQYVAVMQQAQAAWENNNALLAREYLLQLRPVNGSSDQRSFEWHYLWRQIHGDDYSLLGHEQTVYSTDLSRDGVLLAAGSLDGVLKIWDMRTSTVIHSPQPHRLAIHAVKFSPDGKLVATASMDRTIRIYDLDTRRERTVLEGHTGVVNGVAFSSDGKRLASAADDQTIRLWNLDSGKHLGSLTGHTAAVKSLVYSSAGDLLASGGSDKTVRLWKFDVGPALETWTCPAEVDAVAFSADGSRVAATTAADVQVWSVAERKLLLTLSGHARTVQSLAFAPHGDLASGSADGAVKLWSSAGKLLHTYDFFSSHVHSIVFSPDNQHLICAGRDKAIRVTTVGTPRPDGLPGQPGGQPFRLAAIGDESVLAVTKDNKVQIWNLAAPEEARAVSVEGPISVAAIAKNGSRIVLANGATIRLIELPGGKTLATISAAAPVKALTLSADAGTIVALCGDNVVREWSASGQSRNDRKSPADAAAIAVSNKGDRIAAGLRDGRVCVWNAGSTTPDSAFAEHTGPVPIVAFAPDGKTLASGGEDGTIRLWLLGASSSQALARTGKHPPEALEFSSDGKIIAAAGPNNTIDVRDATTLLPLASLRGHESQVHTISIAPSGRWLATADPSGAVRIWRGASLAAANAQAQ